MSQVFLLQAVRDRIRTVLQYSERDCELTLPGGRPPARMGKYFVGVHGGGIRGLDRHAFKGSYEVTVTLTGRINEPDDRIATAMLYKERGGFSDRLRAIALLIAKDAYNFHVSNQANKYIGDALDGTEPTGFRQGLTFTSQTTPREVDGAWFSADPQGLEQGLAADIHFDGAIR